MVIHEKDLSIVSLAGTEEMTEPTYEDDCRYCWGDPRTDETLVSGRLRIHDDRVSFTSDRLQLWWPLGDIRGVSYKPAYPVDIEAAAQGSLDVAQDIAICLAMDHIPDPAISISVEDPEGVYKDGFDIRLIFATEYRAKVALARIDHLMPLRYHETEPVRTAESEKDAPWDRVDRALRELRIQLTRARTEEQFQAIGLTCRELIISSAQAVFDAGKHCASETPPSSTDASRMLDGYFTKELAGATSEAARRYARAALALANDLQHRRTASKRLAALCREATVSVVNLVAIVSGRQAPE